MNNIRKKRLPRNFIFSLYFLQSLPTWQRNIEEIFRKYSIEILQYCKNIYKAVKKVSKILQEPCNVRSKNIMNGILL